MLNEELVVITRIQKYLKDAYQNVADAMIGGGIDNMEKYKYMLGQAQAYLIISQEISNLLEPKEQAHGKENERDDENIIEFEIGRPKD
jgi:hypothetical protein|tara:strand:- start:3584 stop:3847 length:264 start_codon:yes stop_codon:yes gene_type:complete